MLEMHEIKPAPMKFSEGCFKFLGAVIVLGIVWYKFDKGVKLLTASPKKKARK